MLKEYILYLLICLFETKKLLFTNQQFCSFSEKLKKKVFWVIEAINEASAINYIANLSHTLHFTADTKALCSILYSSKNIQIKSCWGPVKPSQLH